ncbi:hypothetical protein M5C72_08605 [Companilactobacillus allii]|uniref:Uncharacterized protein n=1 Tax=Companilactobacillus allii TaxID=1847728 RepID=A0A1P8Q5M4_9LACO|nr:hypothetical protein [Companilactobacillus allii]APX73139.1 hypothetical protein BTM29_11505 [Companilactobacillus allii]USQ67943.1 hypothetical protein M5C72_08605 [Companilactobacillus allii]
MDNIQIQNNIDAQKALNAAMSKTLMEFKFSEKIHQLVNPTASETIDKIVEINADNLTSMLLDNFKASLHEELYLDVCKQIAEHFGASESMFDQK